MGCPCNNKTTTIICPMCHTIQTMSYQKGEDPQAVLEQANRFCYKCHNPMVLKT